MVASLIAALFRNHERQFMLPLMEAPYPNLGNLRWRNRFHVFVPHTDAERQWPSNRTSSIGRFDWRLEEATAKQLTVVNMKQD